MENVVQTLIYSLVDQRKKWECPSKQTACIVSSLHWMADPTRHDGTLYLLIVCSSISLNLYKHIFMLFVYFVGAHIVIQCVASLPSWKPFCSPAFLNDVGWCLSLPGSICTVCIKTLSITCTEGSGCVQCPHVYAPTQEQPVLKSWPQTLLGVHLLASLQYSFLVICHKIMEYPMLEGTHKYHQVPLLVPHRTT